jgi:rod shape-determining protein MreC
MLKNSGFQSSAIFNSSKSVSGNIFEMVASSEEYLNLREQNLKLAKENATLRNMVKSSFDIIPLISSEYKGKDTLIRKKFEFQLAKVINNTSNRQKNYITLNVGSNQGIKKDQAVINSEGIVGVIKDVSPNFSTAISILHRDQKIICKFKKDGSYGPLSWDGSDPAFATLTDIGLHLKVVKGDTIMTAALSDIFPEDISVGIVETFERKSGDAFYTIKVRLSTDFRKLNYVYVIENFFKNEQEELEAKNNTGDNL